MKRSDLSLLMLVALAGCTEQPTSTAATSRGGSNTSTTLAATQSEYIATPRGLYHRSCVHEIPRGARVDASGLVTRADHSTYQIPKCAYASNQTSPAGLERSTSLYLDDWMEVAQDFKSDSNAFRLLTAKWKVPLAPRGSYPGGTTRVYYAYPALESQWDLLMPALAYGYNGSWGGAYWTMTAWYFNATTGWSWKRLSTDPDSTDDVYAIVSASGCANGTCTWSVIVGDSTSPRQAVDTLIVTNETGLYRAADGGAVQVVNVTSCDQFPPTGVYFNSIALRDTTGSVWPASWSEYIYPNSGCYLDVISQNYDMYVHLYHTSLLTTTSISGPGKVKPGTDCIWWANNPTGGVFPYTYSWNPPGVQDSNYVTESWSQSGTLHLSVYDSVGQVATAQLGINVAQWNPVCPRIPAR